MAGIYFMSSKTYESSGVDHHSLMPQGSALMPTKKLNNIFPVLELEIYILSLLDLFFFGSLCIQLHETWVCIQQQVVNIVITTLVIVNIKPSHAAGNLCIIPSTKVIKGAQNISTMYISLTKYPWRTFLNQKSHWRHLIFGEWWKRKIQWCHPGSGLLSPAAGLALPQTLGADWGHCGPV